MILFDLGFGNFNNAVSNSTHTQEQTKNKCKKSVSHFKSFNCFKNLSSYMYKLMARIKSQRLTITHKANFIRLSFSLINSYIKRSITQKGLK